MRFDENDFRHLVAETIVTVNRLGTTSHSVLERYPRFTEMLVQHLSTLDQPFSFEQCIEWVNSLKHDSASTASADYVDWKALHRFVCLLAEQKAGTLSEYRHYLSCTPKMPVTEEYKKMLSEFQVFMKEEGRRINTIKAHAAFARRLLLYLEDNCITDFGNVKNQNILDYIKSDRFEGRSLDSIQTELCALSKFLRFAFNTCHTSNETLYMALPKIRSSSDRIITTVDQTIEADLMKDKPDSLVNKRDKAVLMLALHAGLRSCDIRRLRFNDIDWDREIIHLRQQKTGVDLEIPIDSATQNAIIDYILNERRKCNQEQVFITSVGPIKKMDRRSYRIKYRLEGTDSHKRLQHDGLHIYRRTFASRLLRSGTPLPLISEMLGHIDKNSVRVYLSTDEVLMKRCALNLSLIPCRREEY